MSFWHSLHKIEVSAILTFLGIVLLFSTSVLVVLISPSYIDPSWTQPTSSYQVQMYEVSDPHIYIGTSQKKGQDLQFIQQMIDGYTLSSYEETEQVRLIASSELERYITRLNDPELKLTSRLFLLRRAKEPIQTKRREELQKEWEKQHPKWKEEGLLKPYYEILELFDPKVPSAFVVATPDLLVQNFVEENFRILDEEIREPYHKNPGVIYVKNPIEYRLSRYSYNGQTLWKANPEGEPIKDLKELKSHELGFLSKKELIAMGEHLYAIEGCWYCHTDQTRTLVQDVVLNGSADYPAPPSSANEYIYQQITFAGTRRIGPDLSRVGIKKPGRDWHKGHFWAPKVASKGSIMPAFRHFFDDDPRGTAGNSSGVPNVKFEALFQYLMTKGTRITPPTQGWWIGKDPVDTKAIIEGKK